MGENLIIRAVRAAWSDDERIDGPDEINIQREWDAATPPERDEAMRWFREKCPQAMHPNVCGSLVTMFRDRPAVDPERREEDRRIALQSGLLGQLRKAGAYPVSASGGLGTGIVHHLSPLKEEAAPVEERPLRPSLGVGGLGRYARTEGRGEIDLGRQKGARVEPDRPQRRTGLDRLVVETILRRNWVKMKGAYERALLKHPSLEGRAVVAFTIGSNGGVKDLDIDWGTGLDNSRFRQEIQTLFSQMRFPPPAGGVDVRVERYPLIFKRR